MEKYFEQALRDHVASLNEQQKEYVIMNECMSEKPRRDVIDLYISMGLPFTYTFGLGDGILHILAKKNCPEILKLFLDLGADFRLKNKREESPLHIAASKGNIENIEYLIDIGANLNDLDNQGRTPLMRACESSNRLQAVTVFLEYDADKTATGMEHGRLIGHRIVSKGIKQLIYQPFIDKHLFDHPDEDGILPIHLAVILKKFAMVKAFGKHICDFNVPNTMTGDTAVHYAVQSGNTEILHYVIVHGGSIDIPNHAGHTPMHIAESLNDAIILRTIHSAVEESSKRKVMRIRKNHTLSKSSNDSVDQASKDAKLFRNVINELEKGITKLAGLRSILENMSSYDMTDDEGKTLLHHAAIHGKRQLIGYLIIKRATVNLKDNVQRTPLMYAILSGDKSVVKLLLQSTYDVHAVDAMNNSLFILAYWMEMYDVAKKFLREGADSRGFIIENQS